MNKKSFLKKIKSAESTISMFFGILVVIVVGILLFKYFRSVSLTQNIIPAIKEQIGIKSEEKKETAEEKTSVNGLPTKYVVQKNDNLWKISEKYYQTGYNWIEITKANNLKNPGIIFVGQNLIIPKVAQKADQAFISQAKTNETITGNTYTVVKGDNLWKISVRAYQDGFKWLQIAKANNLSNPSIIHPGNVLVIPR